MRASDSEGSFQRNGRAKVLGAHVGGYLGDMGGGMGDMGGMWGIICTILHMLYKLAPESS